MVEPVSRLHLRKHVHMATYGHAAIVPASAVGGSPVLRTIAADHGITTLYVPKLWGPDRRIANTDDPQQWVPCGTEKNGVRIFMSREPVHGVQCGNDPACAVMFITRDCPTTIITDVETGRTLVLHTGRDLLHPFGRTENKIPRFTSQPHIIDVGLHALEHVRPYDLYAAIVCGIGPHNFPNHWNQGIDGLFYKCVTEWFMNTCGRRSVVGVPSGGHLNLEHIIRNFLHWHHIPRRHIISDHTDTFDDTRYASFRREPGSPYHNGVLVHFS